MMLNPILIKPGIAAGDMEDVFFATAVTLIVLLIFLSKVFSFLSESRHGSQGI